MFIVKASNDQGVVKVFLCQEYRFCPEVHSIAGIGQNPQRAAVVFDPDRTTEQRFDSGIIDVYDKTGTHVVDRFVLSAPSAVGSANGIVGDPALIPDDDHPFSGRNFGGYAVE